RSTLAGVTVGKFSEFTVGSGGSREIPVTFSAVTEGNFTGVVEIETDSASAGGDGIARVNVSGVGVSAFVTASPDRLDFGSVELGSVAMQNLTLVNTTGAEAPYNVTLEGGDAEMFTGAQAGQPLTLAPAQRASFAMAFKPDRLLAVQAFAKV